VTVGEWTLAAGGVIFLAGGLWAVWDWWRTVRRAEEEEEG
jgi:hypothetical protein